MEAIVKTISTSFFLLILQIVLKELGVVLLFNESGGMFLELAKEYTFKIFYRNIIMFFHVC